MKLKLRIKLNLKLKVKVEVKVEVKGEVELSPTLDVQNVEVTEKEETPTFIEISTDMLDSVMTKVADMEGQ